ncbi:MAG: hypothetical protein LDL11_08685 [Desulfarculus sp.]|nr:hypothetical protein [Desulfarculus sp.]
MSGSIGSRVLAALVVVLWLGPALAEDPAELEKGIRDQLASGRTLEACRLAVKMQPFKGRPEYDRARELLLQYGISLASPLESFSIQRMIALQNLLEAQRRQTKALPRTGPYPDHPDAWDVPLRVELITRRAFVYLVRSAGPDRKFLTADDLAVGVRDEAISDTKLRNLRLGLAAGEGQAELPAGPLVESKSSGQDQPAKVEGRAVDQADPRFDPVRAAGRRGLHGVSAPPPGSRPAPAFDPLPSGGARNELQGAGSGKAAPEREITVDELLQR